MGMCYYGSIMTTRVLKCRGCGNKRLETVITLGNLAVSDFIPHPQKGPWTEPLELSLCTHCSMLQSSYSAPNQSRLYREYWYKSGVNTMMKHALGSLVGSMERNYPLSPGDVVVDIGTNDGTLLRAWRRKGIRTVGFEPAQNLVEDARVGTDHIFNDFFSAALYKSAIDRQAKVVTSVAMFYDLDDPHTFTRDIASILSLDGVWVNQMAYTPDMLKNRGFDNICHEHIVHYSLASLEPILQKHGLTLLDVSHNGVNGGSFRTVAALSKSGRKPTDIQRARIAAWKKREILLHLDSPATYHTFMDDVEAKKTRVVRFIRASVARGKRIYAYGASTKGNTLLQYFGLTTDDIAKAVERNPQKWGLFTISTNIPIISESKAREEKPDIFFVLPWHFQNEIVKRERAFLDQGGTLLFPLPTPHLVSINRGTVMTKQLM